MDISSDFEIIIDNTHFWNWAPDWILARDIYYEFNNSFSVLTPFAFSYLEELIRSMTTDYGKEKNDELGNPIKHKVGMELIELAIEDNDQIDEIKYKLILATKQFFIKSSSDDKGDNRHSTQHGYMHPRFWDKESFERLIHHIALLSEFAGF